MNDLSIFSGIKKYYLNLYDDVWHAIKISNKEGICLNDMVKEKPENKIFNKDSYIEYHIQIDPSSAKNNLISMINALDAFDIRDRAEFYYYIKAYGNILYWAERVLLYQNDDTKDSYSVINKDENITMVYFNIDDTLVEISFLESSINLPNKSKDNPLNFMSDDDSVATFVEINIRRNYGNNINDNIKAILGSNDFNLNLDDIKMLDLIENKICNIVISSLVDIENHIINYCCGLKNITIEEIENGITLWRRATK